MRLPPGAVCGAGVDDDEAATTAERKERGTDRAGRGDGCQCFHVFCPLLTTVHHKLLVTGSSPHHYLLLLLFSCAFHSLPLIPCTPLPRNQLFATAATAVFVCHPVVIVAAIPSLHSPHITTG